MSKTFEFQKQLKTLPMNNLNDAGTNFLEWLEPLLNEEQFNKSKNNLKNFMLNEGPVLHKKLEEWSIQNNGNWLAPLWQDMYLDIREALAINVNYFVKLITEELKSKYSSFYIASVIINKLVDVYESIIKEDFEVEKIGTNPMCMVQYKQMFKATRVAKINQDEYIVKEQTKNNHIIVMYKNHMFKVDLNDLNGKRYSCEIISNTLEKLANLEFETNDISMGIITTAPRDEAAVLLEQIVENEKNSENFEVLKEALFVVCMDEESKDLHEFGMSLIASNEDNRYFDKSVQLIFSKNGDFGFNFEHTGADAGSWINIINMIGEELKDIDNYEKDTSLESIKIEQINWQLTNEIKNKLKEMRDEHQKSLENLHLEILKFDDFGNNRIKSLKYSPDAFLQLALQVAQYRTFKTLRSTYEAVSTRAYLKGRTECTRPISMEVLNFVKSIDDESVDITTLKQMMNQATKKHSSRIKDCLTSKGVERYFYAMNRMYELFSEELGLKKLPDFFEDEGYKKLTYSFISTSRIESKYFDLGGFGPVVLDGFGFWYNLLENRIDMSLTTRKNINKQYVKSFAEEILKALKDLENIALKS